MGIAERKVRQKEEIRSSILKSAWELVERDGWQALSIRKIAGAIEYSAPVIYDHFENKEAIMLEFTGLGYRKLNEKLLKAKKEFTDPEKQIEAMAYAYRDFAYSYKEYYQLMYGLGMPSCETVRNIPELKIFADIILESLRDLIEKSKNKTADPFLKLHTFWSMLHGLISINMIGKGTGKDEWSDLVLKDFIEGFVSGIKG